jgi:hypothetical protein
LFGTRNAFTKRRKKAHMMSTALLIAVGGQQTKVHSAVPDRVEGAETSFAQRLGERVALASDVQRKSSAGDVLQETPEAKSSEQLKNLDSPPVASAGAKASVSARQETAELDEPKTSVPRVGKDAPESSVVDVVSAVRTDVSERGESKTLLGQLSVNGGELQLKTGTKVVAPAVVSRTKTAGVVAAPGDKAQPLGDVEDSEASATVLNDAPVAKPTVIESAAREVAVSDQLLLRDETRPLVPNEAMLTDKTTDSVSVKKDVKTQRSEAETKNVVKTSTKTESAKTVEGASIVPGMEGSVSLPIQVPTPYETAQNAGGVVVADVSAVLGKATGKPAAETSTAGTENTGRRTTVQVGKNEGETRGQLLSSAADMTVATGPAAEIAKVAAGASPGVKDGDAKEQSVVGAVATVHGVTGNEAVASGIVPGMTVGHTPTEINETKAQAGTHTVVPQAGFGEQDGSGAVTGEIGMSHRTLLATPTALEVGLANGTQGWLKIRAEMTDGGVVNASLSSATSAGQEMLHRELPALTAYLQEERVAVNTVVVPSTTTAGSNSGFTGGTGGEGNGQAQQDNRQSGGDDQHGLVHGVSVRAEEIPTYVSSTGVGDDGLYSAGVYAGGGSWLNVRA